MASYIDSYTTGMDSQSTIFGITAWQAMIFEASQSYSCGSVTLQLYRYGSPGTLTVDIYATTGSGGSTEPTGSALATGTTNGSTLTTNSTGEEREITFSSAISLVSGTRYAIVCHCDSGDGSNFVAWKKDASSPTYANGHQCSSGDGGSNWTIYTSMDMYFKTATTAFTSSDAPVDKTYSKQLIAMANSEVWRQTDATTMAVVSDASNDIDTTKPLRAAEAFQKVFIVNYENFKVLDLANTKITTADVGSNPPDFGTKITGGTSGAEMIVDYITSTSGACTIYGKRTTTATFQNSETVTGTNPSTSPYGSAVSFTTSAAETDPPHWYDWTVFGADATNYGSMPNRAYNVVRYRGRLSIAVDPDNPHQWYQTRQKNPFDFLFVAGDAQSPVAGNDTDCGEVGDIIKCQIAYHDDYLIHGCANELWYMSGDAAFGGELNVLDDTAGILGDRAWCWDSRKRLYIMSTKGLLRISGLTLGQDSIENLTEEIWPDWASDLAFDSSSHRIVLAFNPEDNGIHIFKTTLGTGAMSAWWYDLRTEGLFPDSYPATMGIYCAHYYQTEDPDNRKLLFGCLDGYIKFLDPSTASDDGTAINSYVGFAPLRLSTHPRRDGMIGNIDIVTGGGESGGSQTDSDDITCEVHVARSAEKIIEDLDGDATPKMTKTLTAPGWNPSNLDRRSVRGQWAGIVLSNNTDNETWSMERLIIDTKEVGRSL